jgi:monoterpene epsilon-lactone hydrolase
MASAESKRIRAGLVRGVASEEVSFEADRRAWEESVEPVNRALDVAVTPVDVDGLRGEWVADPQARPGHAVLFLHGGGYSAGSCKTHRALAARLSRAARAPLLLVDYRLAPEHPFPAAVEDAVRAYRWLLRQGDLAAQAEAPTTQLTIDGAPAGRIQDSPPLSGTIGPGALWGQVSLGPGQIALGGDSAGGGLAVAALVKLRDAGAPLPAGAFLLSPWSDLTVSAPSIETNAPVDPLGSAFFLRRAAGHYLGGAEPAHPLASPLYANLAGLPPLLIHAGGDEILLGDATRLAERASAQGVPVELRVWAELWHVFHAWAPELPEANEAIDAIGAWLRRLWNA